MRPAAFRGLALIGLLAALGTVPAAGSSPVRVEVFEGLPPKWLWERLPNGPADVFEAPALGFVRLPQKYSPRGILSDRAAPFAVHAETVLQAPPGPYRLVLRARSAAVLALDGRILARTEPITSYGTGHEAVPEPPAEADPRWRPLAPGDQERIVAWSSDGWAHRVELWAVVGGISLRPETGELSASIAAPGGVPVLIGSTSRIPLTDAGWSAYAAAEQTRLEAFDTDRRRRAARSQDPYWRYRHDLARREALKQAKGAADRGATAAHGSENPIDRHIEGRLRAAGIDPGPLADDAAFFRRLTLDTVGVVPRGDEVAAFLADPRPDKRARALERRLADPRWADAWMGYWQDVLAENPGILKPTLNNTGPFRRYLYQAFLDGTPFDRFATELIRMEGSALGGGPAGFAMATENDAPMVAKAHILAKAFLAADLKCARCHDAPFHPYNQSDLFGLAGLLAGTSQKVPGSSTIRSQKGGRKPAVSVSLREGDVVPPRWSLEGVGPEAWSVGLVPRGASASPRERLAALVTSPRNERFAPVIVNRLWKRYLGVALVEPVDDWDNNPTFHDRELLDLLARELMAHDYDLKHVARLILGSRAYQRRVEALPPRSDSAGSLAYAMPSRRRMSAEQLVDSLVAVAGLPLSNEPLNLDPDGRRLITEFLSLGIPRRAWELTSTSNERDRPALSLPVTQSLVDLLATFGWRASRPDPISVREEATTPLQPALLANGIVAARVTRLTDDHAITALCLEDQPAEALIRSVFLRVFSRPPTEEETARSVAFLGASYARRVVPGVQAPPPRSTRPGRRVTWSNHLSPEASRIQLERERAVRAGDPPTARLTPEFRERMEDLLWALINSPEFLFLP